MNVDECPETSDAFAIISIPTVKMFVDGVVVDEFIGSMSEVKIRKWIAHTLEQ
jgi:thioredoxin-like negative regulator of GroEL